GSQVAVTQSPVIGDGTTTNPIGLQGGTNAGDVLIWDGSQWQIKPSPFDSVCGTAMANYVQKWTGSELCNSIIYDDGTRVGIGTSTPGNSAILDVSASNKGVLLPRLTSVQRNTIGSPDTGLIIYNKSCHLFEYWNGNCWATIESKCPEHSWCPSLTSWKYRNKIKIYNPNPFSVDSFQIRIEINTSELILAGQMAINGSDIRFTDENCNPIPFYIEGPIPSEKTVIFLLLDSLPDSTKIKTIYMYYGNPFASPTASPPSAIFDYWDDFTGTSLSADWRICVSSAYTVSGSYLFVTNGASISHVPTTPLPYDLPDVTGNGNVGSFVEAKVKYMQVGTGTAYSGDLQINSTSCGGCSGNLCGNAVVHYMRGVASSIYGRELSAWVGSGATANYNIAGSPPGLVMSCFHTADNIWYVIGYKVFTDRVHFWVDYEEACSYVSLTWAKTPRYIILGNYENDVVNIQDTYYDWVRVRKALRKEPVISMYSQETNSCN
ncbi:MAG: DUF2341 domain-containing protein, partial [Chlorobi bacterium]|nr:DUF2341 domain-containing protein [Chlorobiota bacterium]